MNTTPTTLLALLLFAPLLLAPAGRAQAERAATFTLAPGDHRLRDLADLCATIRKTTATCDEATAAALAARLRVQRELRLPADALIEVASAMLFQEGVLLAELADGSWRALTIDDGAALAQVVRTVAPDRALQPSARVEYVTTRLSVAGDEGPTRTNMLRPFLGFSRDPWFASVRFDADEQQVVLQGTTPQVASLLRLLGTFAGEQPEQPARPRWPVGTRRWPSGDALVADFVATFCDALDANVLGELPIATLALGDAAELTTAQWFERATVALHELGYVLSPLCAEHRVFALRSLEQRPAELLWRARHETVEELGGSRAVEPVVVAFELQTMSAVAAMNAVRPRLANSRVSVGSLAQRPRALFVSGLRPDVQAFAEVLLKVDSR